MSTASRSPTSLRGSTDALATNEPRTRNIQGRTAPCRRQVPERAWISAVATAAASNHCGSAQSRNMSLGRALGQGQTLAAVLGSRRSVAEGVYTAAAVARVAAEKGVDMPICAAVNAIVEGRLSVDQAIEALLSRPQRAEA